MINWLNKNQGVSIAMGMIVMVLMFAYMIVSDAPTLYKYRLESQEQINRLSLTNNEIIQHLDLVLEALAHEPKK